MSRPRIYLSPPHLSGREAERIADVLASGWVAPVGPHLAKFERRVAERIGVGHAVATSSGTAALHLALRQIGVGPDDEVICSTLTFCASANPIVYQGARPVFLDSETRSWNLDPNLLADELSDAARRGRIPKAIVVVDIFGQSADMHAILDAAGRYDVPVIEDAAEALGARYHDVPCGRLAKAAMFSFNGNKIITTSGGGMLVSDDEALIEEARFLSTQARDPGPHYQHSRIGYNYRLSNVLAAVGLAQLDVLDDFVAARRRNFDFYRARLGQLPGITFMPEPQESVSSRWLTVMLVDAEKFGADHETVRRALEAENIESRPVWKPLHRQPVFADCRARGGVVAERIFASGLCLPSGSALEEADLERIAAVVAGVAGRGRAAA